MPDRHPLQRHARRHVQGPRTSSRDDLPADRATRDARAARGDGVAGSAPDRRHRRRAPADVARSPSSARPSRADADVDYLFLQVVVGPGRGHRQPELRQHARRRRTVRDRARARGRAGDGHAGAHPHGEHRRRSPSAHVADAGRRGRLRRRRAHRRCARHRRADPDRVRSTSRARAAARCCRPATSIDAHRRASTVTCIDNGMPVVLPARRRPRHDRRRDARPSSRPTRRSRRASRRSGSPPGRCMNLGDVARQDRAEDVPACRRRARAARSARAPSSRTGCTRPSACSAPCASRPPACSRAPWPHDVATLERRTGAGLTDSRSSTPPASSPSSLDVDDVDGVVDRAHGRAAAHGAPADERRGLRARPPSGSAA